MSRRVLKSAAGFAGFHQLHTRCALDAVVAVEEQLQVPRLPKNRWTKVILDWGQAWARPRVRRLRFRG